MKKKTKYLVLIVTILFLSTGCTTYLKDKDGKVITNEKTTTEEKNRAFEKMQSLNQNRGVEETIEKKINTEYKLKSFVKIKDSDVTVVIDSNKHDKAIANKIMRTVQEQFETPMSITVKFQK